MFLKNHNKAAIIWQDVEINYSSVMENVDKFYSLIDNIPAEKIAIFSENRPEWIYAFFAGWKKNATVVPIDHLSTADEVAYILTDCKPDIIFISKEKEKIINDAISQIDYDLKELVFEDIPGDSSSEPGMDFPAPDDERTAVIIYTSGTTGDPKGVMLSFKNLLTNIHAVTEEIKILTADDVYLGLLPFHHIFPLMGTVIVPLYMGGTIAMSPSMSAEDIINTLQKYKVSIIIGVPRLYSAIFKGVKDKINSSAAARFLFNLAEKLNSRSFSRKVFGKVHEKFGGNIKFLVCGGAALNREIGQGFKTLGFELLEGFGMTEAAPMITFTRPGKVKVGSGGQPLTANEVKIADGEVIAKGPNIMKGYYNRPEETKEVLKDGWLYTGDLGYLDEDNSLFITGRRKEIIVLSNGKNINPEEIENKLAEFDLVQEAGVFADGDNLHAVIYPNLAVVQRSGVSNLEEAFLWDVVDKYNLKVSPHKKISNFSLINEELPRTRLSKLKRFLLPELVKRREKIRESVEEPDIEEYEIVKKFLIELKGTSVYPGDHLEIDLGLDSLDRVTFQVFLNETFGLNVKDEDFINYPTVEKLAEHISKTKTKTDLEDINWGRILSEKIHLNLPKSWVTHNIFKNAARILLKSYFRLKVAGHKKIPDGPVIIAPNHQSFFDGLFVASFLKNKHMKKTYFYAKEKHVRNKIVKFIADRHNVIVMDINKDLKSSLQKLASVLEKGKNIIIFPEGTRTKTGDLGKFKKTFAILSRELKVPVVPVAIDGAYEALPKGARWPKPFKEISVKFLDPVMPGEHSYESLSDLVYQKVNAELQ